MKKTKCIHSWLITVGILLLAAAGYGADGSASIKMGYTSIDDTGNVSLNQETYNTYDGFGLSINKLRYGFSNGVTFGANLNNMTQKSRDLRATLGKPGRFNITATHSQYRRNYLDADSFQTKRLATGFQASLQPSRFFKFYGGYNITDKTGASATILPHNADTIVLSTDYKNTVYNVGTQIGDRYGVVKIDYRHAKFDDRLESDADRTSDKYSVSLSSSVPGCKRFFVAGGFTYRKDTALLWNSALQTKELWGGAKLGFRDGYSAEYRLTFDMTKHVNPHSEIDNTTHMFAFGKNWGRIGGVQAAYEQRISDAFFKQTTSNGVIGNIWYRPTLNWSFATRFVVRDKSVTDGTTLTGTESKTSNHVSAIYSDTAWGHIGLKWQSRHRTNEDLNTSVDYVTVTPDLEFDLQELGRLEVSYSYSTGTYENTSDASQYRFLDHLVIGNVYLPSWHHLTFDFGGTYYLCQRDQDLEKTRFNVGGRYTFLKNHHLEARYNVFNYDNFLLMNSYYTSNIVEVNIIKDVSF